MNSNWSGMSSWSCSVRSLETLAPQVLSCYLGRVDFRQCCLPQMLWAWHSEENSCNLTSGVNSNLNWPTNFAEDLHVLQVHQTRKAGANLPKNRSKCVQKVDRSDPRPWTSSLTQQLHWTPMAGSRHWNCTILKFLLCWSLLIFADLVPWPTSHGGSDCSRFAGRMQWVDFLDVLKRLK